MTRLSFTSTLSSVSLVERDIIAVVSEAPPGFAVTGFGPKLTRTMGRSRMEVTLAQ